MAESKYGRLFTEADVRRLIEEALLNAQTDDEDTHAELARLPSEPLIDGMESPFTVRALVERVERDGELTFPADEPLFLLRGQDRASMETIWGYCDWQRAHRDRVKVPD